MVAGDSGKLGDRRTAQRGRHIFDVSLDCLEGARISYTGEGRDLRGGEGRATQQTGTRKRVYLDQRADFGITFSR